MLRNTRHQWVRGGTLPAERRDEDHTGLGAHEAEVLGVVALPASDVAVEVEIDLPRIGGAEVKPDEIPHVGNAEARRHGLPVRARLVADPIGIAEGHRRPHRQRRRRFHQRREVDRPFGRRRQGHALWHRLLQARALGQDGSAALPSTAECRCGSTCGLSIIDVLAGERSRKSSGSIVGTPTAKRQPQTNALAFNHFPHKARVGSSDTYVPVLKSFADAATDLLGHHLGDRPGPARQAAMVGKHRALSLPGLRWSRRVAYTWASVEADRL